MIEKLKNLISQVMPEVNVEKVTLDSKLRDDLGFDSLGIMMLAMAIENEFGITFDGDMKFITVKDVVDYCEANKK